MEVHHVLLTISAFLRGIINKTPSNPPHKAISAIFNKLGLPIPQSFIHINIAGNVNIAPAANDSPAEPIV